MERNLKTVKRRISSARQVRRVTTALQHVSAARLTEYMEPLRSSRIYLEKLSELLSVVARDVWNEHLFMRYGAGRKVALVVLGPGRGLCGGLNGELVRKLKDFMAEHSDDVVDLIIMGKVIDSRVRRLGIRARKVFPQATVRTRDGDMLEMAGITVNAFLAGEFREVYILYTEYISRAFQHPTVVRVLPFVQGSDKALEWGNVLFEPEAGSILSKLVPEYVRQSIDCAFLNSIESENAARQAAMTRASENAEEMIEELTVEYSRLRQDGITTEVVELTSGAVRV